MSERGAHSQGDTGDIFTITDPELHLNQLETVQHDVANLLVHGFNPPAPAPEAATSVESAAEPAEPATPETRAPAAG